MAKHLAHRPRRRATLRSNVCLARAAPAIAQTPSKWRVAPSPRTRRISTRSPDRHPSRRLSPLDSVWARIVGILSKEIWTRWRVSFLPQKSSSSSRWCRARLRAGAKARTRLLPLPPAVVSSVVVLSVVLPLLILCQPGRCSSVRPYSFLAKNSSAATVAATLSPRSRPTARAIVAASTRTTLWTSSYTVRVKVERAFRSPPPTRPPIDGNRGIIRIVVAGHGHVSATASSARLSAVSRRKRPMLRLRRSRRCLRQRQWRRRPRRRRWRRRCAVELPALKRFENEVATWWSLGNPSEPAGTPGIAKCSASRCRRGFAGFRCTMLRKILQRLYVFGYFCYQVGTCLVSLKGPRIKIGSMNICIYYVSCTVTRPRTGEFLVTRYPRNALCQTSEKEEEDVNKVSRGLNVKAVIRH